MKILNDRYNGTPSQDGSKLITLNDFLPPKGNYRTACRDIKVVATIPPNVEDPVYVIMECMVPKKQGNVVVRYFKSQIQFKYKKDIEVNTTFDGKLVIGQPDPLPPTNSLLNVSAR